MASRESVSDFISQLEAERAQANIDRAHRNSQSTKLMHLQNMARNVKEQTIQDVFTKIYRDALPLDNGYKIASQNELDNGVIAFIKSRTGGKGVYQYITEKKNSSKQARCLCEAVETEVDNFCRKFYEDLNEKDIDDLVVTDEERKSIVDKVTDDLDYPEISQMINDHVQEQIRDEMERTKQEEEHLKELEDSLANDETLTTESAIEEKLVETGEKKFYQPSLFNGIMINQVNLITEAAGDLDESHIQKKAFFETVKEYTKWDMLSTLGFENFTEDQINFEAVKYAQGNI